MLSKLKQSPHLQNQAVGLLVLAIFIFLSTSTGYMFGKDAGRSETPQAIARDAALDAASDARLSKIVETAVSQSDRACSSLADLLSSTP